MDFESWEQRYAEEVVNERNEPIPPLPFVTEIAGNLKPGRALDLASGMGRHAIWLAQQSWSVTAVDGSPTALRILRQRAGKLAIETRIADLVQHDYSIDPETWDLIVISLYLQRDLFAPAKLGLKPGGVLIAITLLGRAPELPRYRLLPGELKTYFGGWEILAYSESWGGDSTSSQARIAVRKPHTEGLSK